MVYVTLSWILLHTHMQSNSKAISLDPYGGINANYAYSRLLTTLSFEWRWSAAIVMAVGNVDPVCLLRLVPTVCL